MISLNSKNIKLWLLRELIWFNLDCSQGHEIIIHFSLFTNEFHFENIFLSTQYLWQHRSLIIISFHLVQDHRLWLFLHKGNFIMVTFLPTEEKLLHFLCPEHFLKSRLEWGGEPCQSHFKKEHGVNYRLIWFILMH